MAKAAKKNTEKTKSELRKEKRKAYKTKLTQKLRDDKEFKKAYFDGKSKRSSDKKVAFRRRHAAK